MELNENLAKTIDSFKEELNKLVGVHLGKAGDGSAVKPYITPDEVDAYAYTLAVSLINQKAIENKKRTSITKTQTYKIYCHFFGKNSDITNRLIKKSKTYYRHLEREYHDFYNKN